MKFTLLDSRVEDSKLHEVHQQHPNVTTDKYQYLDDLLDKTFLFDYFLVHDVTDSSNK